MNPISQMKVKIMRKKMIKNKAVKKINYTRKPEMDCWNSVNGAEAGDPLASIAAQKVSLPGPSGLLWDSISKVYALKEQLSAINSKNETLIQIIFGYNAQDVKPDNNENSSPGAVKSKLEQALFQLEVEINRADNLMKKFQNLA